MAKGNIIIGEIGNSFPNFKNIIFDSNQSLLDFDIIFIDLNYISTQIYYPDGTANSYSADSLWVQEDKNKLLEKRAGEIREYLQEGRILVIFLPTPQIYNFLNGRTTNGKTFLNTALSPRTLLVEAIEGDKIEVIPKTKFAAILKKYEQLLFYKSSFYKTAVVGTPLAKIKKSEKVIASYEGNLIFIPSISDSYSGETDQINSFGKEIVQLLIPNDIDYTLPTWTQNYLLPGENKLIEAQDEIYKKFEKIEKENLILENKYEKLNKQKILISGTGDSLEKAIESIFKELGVSILESEANRDDLIIEYKDKIAVIEIKGVNKSGTEEHATQLEKWVTEYALDNKITPKGILIVNTFRELELSKRTGINFPDQMKKYSVKRDHCLMTTVQFLGLYYDCLNKPESKELIINKLFGTVGELDEYKNWNEFIKLK